jgi:hypothetical protein
MAGNEALEKLEAGIQDRKRPVLRAIYVYYVSAT